VTIGFSLIRCSGEQLMFYIWLINATVHRTKFAYSAASVRSCSFCFFSITFTQKIEIS
jgi:hypothetical protein